jgi:uncharacterized protein DUF4159
LNRLRSTTVRMVLAVLLATFCAGGLSAAPLTVARLKYEGGDWYCDPGSLANLLREFQQRTGIATTADPAVVDLGSEDLYRYPMLYLSGHGAVDMGEDEVVELRRFLDAGGFLWADDNYGLDASFRQLAARLYPEAPLARIGSEHPIYGSFYDLPGLPKVHEHDGDPAQGFGVIHDERLKIFYSWSSDIGDGLEDPQVHGDPAEVREAAVRMAVNVMMYALTHP